MANAKCLNCTAMFQLAYPKQSSVRIQCPKCGNKATVRECYEEYEKYTDGEYKTSVFSICTAFMYIGLVLPGTVSGYIQEAIGYVNAFWVVMACCIPSIVITYLVYRKL